MALIKIDFDGFIEMKNTLHMSMFYTEDEAGFGLYFPLEGQIFGASLSLEELRNRFGSSEQVLNIFRSTYLSSARRIISIDLGGGMLALHDFKVDFGDVNDLKSTLADFLSEFKKITTTATGGQGTAGYALIPVAMGSGKARRCMSCGNIILSGSDRCPACGSANLDDKNADMDLKKYVGWDFQGTIKWIIKFMETYTLSQITDISDEEKKKIKEMLINSLTQGWTLGKLESEIDSIVHDENKARLISRTEVIRASNEGALLQYEEENQAEKVRWFAVPGSPGGRTCDKCMALNGKEFLIKDAKGKIPAHVACRCCWLPLIK